VCVCFGVCVCERERVKWAEVVYRKAVALDVAQVCIYICI